jgi:hypothetical protein
MRRNSSHRYGRSKLCHLPPRFPRTGYKLSTPSPTPASSGGHNGAIRLARGTLNQPWINDGE